MVIDCTKSVVTGDYFFVLKDEGNGKTKQVSANLAKDFKP
jgi:hypothetical protein